MDTVLYIIITVSVSLAWYAFGYTRGVKRENEYQSEILEGFASEARDTIISLRNVMQINSSLRDRIHELHVLAVRYNDGVISDEEYEAMIVPLQVEAELLWDQLPPDVQHMYVQMVQDEGEV